MPKGPVQILVVGYGPDAELRGAALEELKRLSDADVVRLLDLVVVRKGAGDDVEVLEIGEEVGELGALVGSLVGLGEDTDPADDVSGADLDEIDAWYPTDSIPEGTTAAIALIEHRWAIPLRDTIIEAGGGLIADAWVHPLDLEAIGAA